MAKEDAVELDDEGKSTSKRRFDKRDFGYIADYVNDEYEQRKRNRSDREREWKDIDRQVAMKPELGFKQLPDGSPDKNKTWMAEIELPLQAQALEVLTADCRRMLFADSGPWFRAHAAMTDEYLSKVDFKNIIAGDEAEVPSQINQDNADKLVEGFLLHMFAQDFNDEDFFTRCDRIDAESLKYGMGVGRARMYKKSCYTASKAGVHRETQTIPMLAPCSIKNLYLDDPKPSMHSAQLLEPAHIAVDHIKLENLHMAASRGSTDPNDEDGGWMPAGLKDVVPDNTGFVTLLEMEGDIVVPRKTTRSMVLPGCIVTVAVGGKGSGTETSRAMVRFRWRKNGRSSYLLFPYHFEGADDRYPTSPLMKGRPVQMAATDALNRLLDSALLKVAPPIGYDKNDVVFGQKGGPQIYPYAQWGTTDPVKVYTELGGDPGVLAGVMAQFINLYAELTGVLPARLGAQTVSHTTAFAKDAELQRGAVRTVDYVNQVGKGAMTRWLGMAYQMGRDAIGSREQVRFHIGAYGGYVEVSKEQLPEYATFEWFGSGGPAEARAKQQAKMQSLMLGVQIDQIGASLGRPPKMNLDGAQAEALREGGWTDLDAILHTTPPNAPLPAPMPDGPATAAMQGIPSVIGQ
jgi:hypothetical protein